MQSPLWFIFYICVGYACLVAPSLMVPDAAEIRWDEERYTPRGRLQSRTYPSQILSGKLTFRDGAGKQVVSGVYEEAGHFNEGLCNVRVNEKWGYINKNGQMVIADRFDNASPFSNGLAAVAVDEKWGYVDHHGKMIIKPQFSCAAEFDEEGFAEVSVGDSYCGVIDKAGRLLQRPVVAKDKPADANAYLESGPYINGFAHTLFKDKTWGFVDRQGKRIHIEGYGVADMYLSENYAHSTLAKVLFKKRFGWADLKERKMVVPPIYDQTFERGDGFISVFVNGKWGVVDKVGQTIVEPRLPEEAHFNEGVAAIRG